MSLFSTSINLLIKLTLICFISMLFTINSDNYCNCNNNTNDSTTYMNMSTTTVHQLANLSTFTTQNSKLPDVKWLNDNDFLMIITSYSSKLIVIDTRSSNEFNGWRSFEKNEPKDVLKGHIRGSHNFDADWIFLFNQQMISDIMEKRIGINTKPNSTNFDRTQSDFATKVEVLLYDGKLERLETVRDLLMSSFAVDTIYLYKIIDKSSLLQLFNNHNKTNMFVHEPFYDWLIPPEYLYTVIFNPTSRTMNNTKPIKYKLFDISYGNEDLHYGKGHIPTSIHLDTNEVEAPPIWNRKSKSELAKLLLDLGIRPNNTELIILYGNPDPMASYRVAVIMKWMGVKNIRILNGGYNFWLQRNFPIEKKYNKRMPIDDPYALGDYENPNHGPANYIVDMDFVRDIVQNYQIFGNLYSLVDVRAWSEYIGEISGYNDIIHKGRIPGAQWGKAGSIPNELEEYRNPDATMRSPVEIRRMWVDLGIAFDNKHLIFYCGTGWRAAEVLIYAEIMGLTKVSLYDGGWYEWSMNPNNTIESGLPQVTEFSEEQQTTASNENLSENSTPDTNATTRTTNTRRLLNCFLLILTLLSYHLIL